MSDSQILALVTLGAANAFIIGGVMFGVWMIERDTPPRRSPE